MGRAPGSTARYRRRLVVFLAILAALLLAFGGDRTGAPVHAQDEPGAVDDETGDAGVRVVHGASDAGAVDLYVDGAVAISGITYPSISDVLFLPAGDHEVQIVSAGVAPDQAIVTATLSLDSDRFYEIAALGTLADLQANVYEVDLGPLGAGQARLRLVHGVPDAGSVEVAVTDGDALLPPVDYPNETDYLDLTAGTYDLELRAEDGTAISLVGTELEEGVVYDFFVVGQVADDSLQLLTVASTPETAAVTGRPAALYAGGCGGDNLGEVVTRLNGPALPPGDPLGQTDAAPAENSVTAVELTLDDILAADHAIAVFASEAEDATVVACGEVGGALTENGALVVGLREENGSGVAGIAILAPSAVDPAATDVSVLIADDLVGTGRDAANAEATEDDTDEAEAEPGRRTEAADANDDAEPGPTAAAATDLDAGPTVEPEETEEEAGPTAAPETDADGTDGDGPRIAVPTEEP